MFYKTCEICGLRSGRTMDRKRTFMAKFPLDEDRCKKWVKLTGKEDLAYVPIEKLHTLKYVCGKHFRDRDFKKKKTQLKKNAVPSLMITAEPLQDEILVGFPLHIATENMPIYHSILTEHNYCLPYEAQMCTASVTKKTDDRKRQYSLISEPSTATNIENIKKKRAYSPKPSTSTVEPSTSTNIENIKKKRAYSPKPSTSTVEPSTSTNIENIKKKRAYSPKSTAESTTELNVSPRKLKLLKKLKKNKETLKNLKKKLDQIKKISSPVLKSLIESTIKNQKRKSKGKRWTKLNKSVALAIYKKSPKAYRYLSQLLPMPSVRTLQIVLAKMTMEPGIDVSVMAHLKKKAEDMTDQDKTCVLLFDEMALKKRFIYNIATDKVDGFQDLASEGGRSEKIADHALVFMLQGLHRKIKQPIAHYFVKGTISTEKLVVIIKTVIRAVTEAGYKVLSTVCDQGPTNIGAINLLKKFSGNPVDSNYFLLDEEKVFIVYDVPHLFKSIRNNFFQAGELAMNGKKAKWSHLVQLVDKNQSTLHFMKISEAHIDLKYRAKMKVKLAAQLLSNTVSAILKLLSESVENKEHSIEILETAHIIEDLDKLFDCTNGPGTRRDIKKKVRQNVTKRSFHHERWRDCIKKLKTLHFVKSDSKLRLSNVRCVNGYIITISSLMDMWKYVESKKFKFLNLRQCNQDALENLFGLIRQHSPTNRNPTCHHFTSALKSSILTRLSTPVSRGSNCEQDENKILFDFHDIVFATRDEHKEINQLPNVIERQNEDDDIPVLHIPEAEEDLLLEEIENNFMTFEKQPTVYVSGYIAKTLLKNIHCQTCISSMKVEDPKPNSIYNYIELKEWWTEKSLTYPTLQLCQTIDKATTIFDTDVKPRLFEKQICQYSITAMLVGTDLSWLCSEHEQIMKYQLLRRLSLLLIRNECKMKNKSLASLEEPLENTVKKAQQL